MKFELIVVIIAIFEYSSFLDALNFRAKICPSVKNRYFYDALKKIDRTRVYVCDISLSSWRVRVSFEKKFSAHLKFNVTNIENKEENWTLQNFSRKESGRAPILFAATTSSVEQKLRAGSCIESKRSDRSSWIGVKRSEWKKKVRNEFETRTGGWMEQKLNVILVRMACVP